MGDWIGSKRKISTDESIIIEEIIDIGSTWVTVRTYDVDDVYDETFEYKSQNDLLEALSILDYE